MNWKQVRNLVGIKGLLAIQSELQAIGAQAAHDLPIDVSKIYWGIRSSAGANGQMNKSDFNSCGQRWDGTLYFDQNFKLTGEVLVSRFTAQSRNWGDDDDSYDEELRDYGTNPAVWQLDYRIDDTSATAQGSDFSIWLITNEPKTPVPPCFDPDLWEGHEDNNSGFGYPRIGDSETPTPVPFRAGQPKYDDYGDVEEDLILSPSILEKVRNSKLFN